MFGKRSDEDNHEGHEPDVSWVPDGVVVGCSVGHDVGKVLDDLLLKGSRNLRA